MLEHYDVDSVSYAVIYNGDIILKGSSDTYQIEKIIDFREYLNAQLGNYTGAIGAVTQMIVLVSLLISSLILVMTVRSIISKRRRELGILKSNGFTTKQLARQMAISFLPMTAFGVVLGCAAGAFTVSPAMGAALSAAGAENVALAVDPLIVTILGAVILLVTYIVANISALRIKHISVYELLTE
jgi:putative ABC transport system permease protein